MHKMHSLYSELAPATQDSWGFIQTDHCDSLLYTSLLGTAGINIADIEAAHRGDGYWVRRPQYRPGTPEACYPGNSKSSTSRDMTIGLMWYLYTHSRLDLAEGLWDYQAEHAGKLGEGDWTRIGIRWPLRATLSRLIESVGGPDHGEQLVATLPLSAEDGFAGHLQMLHITLRGELYGFLSERSVSILESLAEENPDSPVMQAAAARWGVRGAYNRYLSAARNTRYWPPNRLPTSADRCLDWLHTADDHDWEPCPSEGKTHSGGDWLFAYHLIFELDK